MLTRLNPDASEDLLAWDFEPHLLQSGQEWTHGGSWHWNSCNSKPLDFQFIFHVVGVYNEIPANVQQFQSFLSCPVEFAEAVTVSESARHFPENCKNNLGEMTRSEGRGWSSHSHVDTMRAMSSWVPNMSNVRHPFVQQEDLKLATKNPSSICSVRQSAPLYPLWSRGSPEHPLSAHWRHMGLIIVCIHPRHFRLRSKILAYRSYRDIAELEVWCIVAYCCETPLISSVCVSWGTSLTIGETLWFGHIHIYPLSWRLPSSPEWLLCNSLDPPDVLCLGLPRPRCCQVLLKGFVSAASSALKSSAGRKHGISMV